MSNTTANVEAATAHGTKGLLPDGAAGLVREISCMMFSVRFGEILKLSNASLIIVSSFCRRCCARRRRLLTVFADTPKNEPISVHDISPK